MRDLIETALLYALAIGVIAATFSTLSNFLNEILASALSFRDTLGL